jgi:hypothetical protein
VFDLEFVHAARVVEVQGVFGALIGRNGRMRLLKQQAARCRRQAIREDINIDNADLIG